MPQDITINGAQYPDVPAVQIPKTGGGIAQFDDTTDATATASEIASGKSAYVNGTRLLGTGQMVEPPLYIDDTINSIGIGEAPTATNYLVNTLNSSFRGQYNDFYSMPYSWSTAGVDNVQGYARIATITARGTAPNLSMPIRFEVFRNYDSKPINMYLRLAFTMDYNPSIEGLYYERGDGIYNNSFSAFARKTGTGTYDVYVRKETASAWIGVNTYIPAYMLYRMAVSYANDLYTFVPSDAVIATELHIINEAKYNTIAYMPYSAVVHGTNGTAGYAKIATIQVVGTWVYSAIEFDVVRSFDMGATRYSLYFETGSGTTPSNIYFLHGDYSRAYKTIPPDAFVVISSSTLDVYVRKCTDSDTITVTTYASSRQQDKVNITYSEGQYNIVPSGATMARLVPVTTNFTPVFNKTSGNSNISGVKVYQSGNTIQVYLVINVTGTVGVTDNIWVGTYGGFPLPVNSIPNCTMNGNSMIVGYWGSAGNLTFRNFGEALSSGAPIGFGITYLTNG